MTGTLQGVALSANPKLNEIWMTADGGQTWQLRPIRASAAGRKAATHGPFG